MNELSKIGVIIVVSMGSFMMVSCKMTQDGNKSMTQDQNQAVSYFENELEFTTNPGGAKAVVEGKRPNVTIIDVRSAEAFAKGHIPGAINISHKDFNNFDGDNDKFEGLRKDGYNYVYCYEALCNLSQKAALKFAKQGYAVKDMKGGFKSWEEHGYPVEK
jgi:rhodanese-related sulfurtransferase